MLIRSINIFPPLALAPMVGLSHTAFRRLLGELGGVGLFFSEMLDASRLAHENSTISPVLKKTDSEFPLFYQIFLADDVHLEAAVDKLAYLSIQGIDLNLGCPAPQLRKISAGAFLAENPERVRKIVRKLRKLTELPCSAKIRLGTEEEPQQLLDFCMMLADEGIDLLTIHARYKHEKFCRKPHWEKISEVKHRLNIPVIANGGIFSVEDARVCLQRSGADGLMLGRGIVEKPWLAAAIANEVYACNLPEIAATKKEIYQRFFALVRESFTPERQLGRLKQFTAWYCRSFTFGHHLATAVQASKNMEEAGERANIFFDQCDDLPK